MGTTLSPHEATLKRVWSMSRKQPPPWRMTGTSGGGDTGQVLIQRRPHKCSGDSSQRAGQVFIGFLDGRRDESPGQTPRRLARSAPAFKTGGVGDPGPAGSIPVRLRY